MITNLGLHGSVALGVDEDRTNLGTLLLGVVESAFCKPLGPFLVLGDDVADEGRFFVSISSEKRLALANQLVTSQVAVNLIELDAESANLDLVIGSASDGSVARVVQVVAKITTSVDSVAGALVVLSPGLLGEIGNRVIGIHPLLVVDVPVVDELFVGLFSVIKITVNSMLARKGPVIIHGRILISAKPAALR